MEAQFAKGNSLPPNLSARMRNSAVSGSREAAGPNTSRYNAVEIDAASALSSSARNDSTNSAPLRWRHRAGDSPHEFDAPEQQLHSSAMSTEENVLASAFGDISPVSLVNALPCFSRCRMSTLSTRAPASKALVP